MNVVEFRKIIIGILYIIFIDCIYLYLNKSMYNPIMDPSGHISIPAAILSWIVIVIGIQFMVLSRDDLDKKNVFFYGALLGFSMYALYNTTSFAIYPDKWTVKIAFVDTLWGSLLCGATAYLMYNYF